LKTICVVFALVLSFGCSKSAGNKQEKQGSGTRSDCQVTGSCKACTPTAGCPSGEICTTFSIGGAQYSGCISEHGCSAPDILAQAAEKCGTANPIAVEGGSGSAAGSAAPPK
jgi:hypothetical protein